MPQYLNVVSLHETCTIELNFGNFSVVSPKQQRDIMLTVCIIGFAMLTALLVPSFEFLSAICGAIGGSLLSFVFPAALFLCAQNKLPALRDLTHLRTQAHVRSNIWIALECPLDLFELTYDSLTFLSFLFRCCSSVGCSWRACARTWRSSARALAMTRSARRPSSWPASRSVSNWRRGYRIRPLPHITQHQL